MTQAEPTQNILVAAYSVFLRNICEAKRGNLAVAT